MRKIFLMCLMILLILNGTAFAKDKGLPEGERIKIAVEVSDTSRHPELNTADNLEKFLSSKLVEKNLLNVLKPAEEMILDGEIVEEEKPPVENLGELLVFDAVELPAQSSTPENFDQNFYLELGAAYVIRCEVLALGLTKVEDKTIATIFGAAGGLTSVVGAWTSGSAGKTLRRVGTGVGLGGFVVTERTALANVINMQFISVETGEILWQEHFTGLGIKHKKPRKGYDDAWTQAYMESVENSAVKISKRVNKYVDKVLIKGKSDKDFQTKSKGFSVGALGGARF